MTRLIAALRIIIVALVQDIVPARAPRTSNWPQTPFAATGSAVLATFHHRVYQPFVQPILLFPVARILGSVGPRLSIVPARTLERSRPLPRSHAGMAFAVADTWHQMALELSVKATNVVVFFHTVAMGPIFVPMALDSPV